MLKESSGLPKRISELEISLIKAQQEKVDILDRQGISEEKMKELASREAGLATSLVELEKMVNF